MADRREYYKRWKKDNKDHIKQYHAEYYKLNRDEILAKQASDEKRLAHRSEQIVCDLCKACVRRHHMARHHKTNKCINNCDTSSSISTSVGSDE